MLPQGGARLPSITPVRMLPAACEASKAVYIWGRANDMGLSLEVGARYSIQSLGDILSLR